VAHFRCSYIGFGGLCVRDGLAAFVCAHVALLLRALYAASVEPLPQGSRSVAFPRWLHVDVQSCSTWLIVILIVLCCFGGLCVRDGLAACLRMSYFCAASVEPLPQGLRAVAFPRSLHVL